MMPPDTVHSAAKILSVTCDLPPVSIGGYEVGVWHTSRALAKEKHLDLWFLTSLRGVISGDIPPEQQVLRILPKPGYFVQGTDFEAHHDVNITCHQRRLAFDLMIEALDMIQPAVVIFWQTFFFEEACKSSLYDLRILSELNSRKIPYRIFLSGPGLLPIQFRSLKKRLLSFDFRGLYRWYFYKQHVGKGKFPIETVDLKWEWVGFCSEYLKNSYIAQDFPAENARVIHWGMDLPKNQRDQERADTSARPRVLWAGRICEDKGLHIVIQALKEFKEQEVELDIYGYVQDTEYFLGVQKELDLLSGLTVNYRGFIQPDELRTRLSEYDVFLLSSIYEEPFSIALLEAAAAGLALVASRTGGTPEFAKEKYALLYEPHDADALHQHLRTLASSQDKVSEWKKRALRGAEQFTMKKCAQHFGDWIGSP